MRTKRKPSATGLDLDTARLLAAVEDKRKERGLTQHRLAETFGVDYSTLYYWRRGDTIMGADIALRICVFLGADLRDFVKQPADPPPETQGKAA